MEFEIKGIVERDDEYGNSFTSVRVTIDAKVWAKAKKNGHLGFLYGVDISNQLHTKHGIPAYNPTVDDKARAVKGIKTISLTYYKTAKPKPVLRLVYSAA